LGYATERLVTFDWQLTGGELNRGPARRLLIEQAQARLAGVPGVTRVALADQFPLTTGRTRNTYYVEGKPVPTNGQQGPMTDCFVTNGDYFATLRIAQIAGRTFNAQDESQSPRVAIVDTKFVEKNFPGQDPIGKRFAYGNHPPRTDEGWMRIVGVVGHVRSRGPRLEMAEQAYVPFTQDPPNWVTFVLRTGRKPASLVPELRAAMHEVSKDRPMFSVTTMDGLFAEWVAAERVSSILLGIFASLALLLAAVGLYGVLSYRVGLRTHEIGVRMGLGATTRSVVGLVLRSGLSVASVGLSLGLLASLGLTRLLRSVLFGVTPFDAISFAAGALVLAAIGLLACWIPARRAAKVDPMVALRCE
jgi:putative ABC transport system permease protein